MGNDLQSIILRNLEGMTGNNLERPRTFNLPIQQPEAVHAIGEVVEINGSRLVSCVCPHCGSTHNYTTFGAMKPCFRHISSKFELRPKPNGKTVFERGNEQ